MVMLRTVLVFAVLGLVACGGDTRAGGATPGSILHKTKKEKPAAHGPTREQQTAGMVSAASPRHSADIGDLKFEIATRPEAGKPLKVEIALLPSTDSSSVTLEISGSDGLAVTAEDAAASFSDVTRLNAYRKSVSVTPAAEGMYFLSVLATFKNADFTDARNFTIPIIVEPVKVAAATPARTSPAGAPARVPAGAPAGAPIPKQ